MPVKALFSPFNEVIFGVMSKYHPSKISNSLIFNELRPTDKMAGFQVLDYQVVKNRRSEKFLNPLNFACAQKG